MLVATTYHKVLRTSLLVFALVMVFQSGLVLPQTAELARVAEQQVASVVGVGARVEPTELNQYTAALTAMEQELLRREAELQEREIEVAQQLNSGGASPYGTFVLSAILFILLVLIVLNYTLDYLRAREDQLSTAV
jgi:hypothetical protein